MKNFVRFVVKTDKLKEPCESREVARSLKRELKSSGYAAVIERQEYTLVDKKIIR